MRASFLAKTEEVDKLTDSELEIWNSYQKFLACFDGMVLTADTMSTTAALLTLAMETRIKRKIGGY